MKIWKLVSGILSIIFSVIMIGQALLSSVYEASTASGYSGIAGLLAAAFILSAGITSIVTRKGETGGSIATLILYVFASAISFPASSGIFEDLVVWGSWAAICAAVLLINFLLRPAVRTYFYRILLRPTFLFGCGCAIVLGAVFGTVLPLIVYCVGYPFAVSVSEKRSDCSKQPVVDVDQISADVAQPNAEKTIYNVIIIVGIVSVVSVVLFAIYRTNT